MKPREHRPHFYTRRPDGTIETTDDVIVWGKSMENDENRIVARTELPVPDGVVCVSTVFLGVDHNFGWDKDRGPILFETMVHRESAGWGEQWRWRTEDEARRAHALIVARLRATPDADLDQYDPLEAS